METDTEQIYTGNGSAQTIEITVLMTPFEFLERNKLISEETKAFVTERTLQNLYNAEAKRMSLPEKMGFDGETKGRGQIGEPAYNDVMAKFKNEYNKYTKNNQINKSNIFAKDIKNEKLEDFLVTFYLALCIQRRQKEGRSSLDAAKFGIAYYHGASSTILKYQENATDKLTFIEIEKALKKGSKKENDLIDYIYEVLNQWNISQNGKY